MFRVRFADLNRNEEKIRVGEGKGEKRGGIMGTREGASH